MVGETWIIMLKKIDREPKSFKALDMYPTSFDARLESKPVEDESKDEQALSLEEIK